MRTKRHNSILALVIFITLTLFLTGCGEKPPIKVGFVAGLTGTSSELGVTGRNGVLLAVDKINNAGGIDGRPIELVIKDDKNNGDAALKADKELVAEEVVAIIGHFTSGTNMPVISYINEAQVLMISPTVSTEALTGKDDYFLRVIAPNRFQSQLLADAAISKENVKKIAVIYDLNNKAYSEQVYLFFKESFEKQGGKIVLVKTFSSEDSDEFEKIAREISLSGAEGVLVSTDGTNAALLCQRICRYSPKVKVFSGMWGMTSDFIKNGGETAEGIYFAGIYDQYNTNKNFVEFRQNYLRDYKVEPTFSSLYAYETAKILFSAMGKSTDLNSATLKKNIINNSFPGVQQESIAIDKFGDSTRGYNLFKVVNKQFKRVN